MARNPADEHWWTPIFQLFTGAKKEVNSETALSLATVFACVRLLSFTMGMTPLGLYRRNADDSREAAKDDELSRLLSLSPSTGVTAFSWKQVITSHLLLYGNAFIFIEKDQRDNIKGLKILQPQSVVKRRQNGKVTFLYTPTGSVAQELREEEVVHLMYLSTDGFIGRNPIQECVETFKLNKAVTDHTSNYFQNNGFPSGYIKVPGRLKDDESAQRLKKDFESKTGPSNSGKPILLEKGLEFQEAKVYSARDAQIIETFKLSKEMIVSIYGVPPHLVQDLSRATFSNISSEALNFSKWTLAPLAAITEEGLNLGLLRDRWPDMYIEYNMEGLLRGDAESRYNAYKIGREWGWLCVNDIRRLENMNPIGEIGDIFIVPSNYQAADALLNPPEEEQPNNTPTNQLSDEERFLLVKRTFKDLFTRILNRELKASERIESEKDTVKASVLASKRDRDLEEVSLSLLFNLSQMYLEVVEQRKGCSSSALGSAIVQFVLRECKALKGVDIGQQAEEASHKFLSYLRGLHDDTGSRKEIDFNSERE